MQLLAIFPALERALTRKGRGLVVLLTGYQAPACWPCLDLEIAELDALIEARFHEHPHAKVTETMPGMGPRLGAEFLAPPHRRLERTDCAGR